MEISKTYDPSASEKKWYQHWQDNEFFRSVPDDREPFTIVIPPPNVTGVLHMGHMLNNTIQDILIRKARMEGKNACWVPGTDHASVATEAKVVGKLRDQGISKREIGREKFLEHAYEWKDTHEGIIIDQLKTLGASCDWERTRFTMEPKLNQQVIKVFIDLHRKGFIYRDLRMVNWDPKAQTTLSNEEVIYREMNDKLYFAKYAVEDSDTWITIATTRPETIMGDTAISVNPNDERYKDLVGKKAIVPLVNRAIPIIADDYVDMEFGTGCLKVTPAHDTNDYEIGQRHNLETIDTLNPDGTLNEAAQFFVGDTREVARKKMVEELEKLEQLVKVEDLTHSVGFSERNPDTVIEPRLSLQWFVDMQKLVAPALEHVMNDDIQIHPPKFKNTYRHWMENIRDWPISRQLWWGQQIPAYYYGESGVAVAESPEEALEIARKDSGKNDLQLSDLKQDEDVVDTWFSSWLWPISVFDGLLDPENEDIKYYYPTNVLVTGWDIIFFWVARMVMAGYEYKGEKPFKHVYFTGMVRDMQRRKMSKSLGNSPDLLQMLADYGADAGRFGIIASSPAGNDLLFDMKLVEQGRNFCNKIWNSMRLIKGWDVSAGSASDHAPIDWFHARLQQVKKELQDSLDSYRLSEALMSLYRFIWDDYCSWYLEMVKPAYGEKLDQETYDRTIEFFEEIIQLLHPFMPFITEECWHIIKDRKDRDCVTVSTFPTVQESDPVLAEKGEWLKELVTKIRELRVQLGIKNKEALKGYYTGALQAEQKVFLDMICKLVNLESFEHTQSEPANAQQILIKGDKFFIETGVTIDAEEERAKLEEELKYTQGFVLSVKKKLENSRFVDNAPEAVVAKEKQKLKDGEAKLKQLEDSLAQLS